jgi:Tol biopolymer transport system component
VADSPPKYLSFVSKEPVEGETLDAVLARGPVPTADALRWALEAGAALQEAHAAGIVHGSLSTSGVLLVGGAARVAEPEPAPFRVTRFSAPEQLAGAEADHRSDIFAFGALLYELVSGWPAFPGETESQLRAAIVEVAPPPVSILLASRIPAQAATHWTALDGIIAGCLAKDPDRRRQRIQNALIELKLIARPLSRLSGPAKQSGLAVSSRSPVRSRGSMRPAAALNLAVPAAAPAGSLGAPAGPAVPAPAVTPPESAPAVGLDDAAAPSSPLAPPESALATSLDVAAGASSTATLSASAASPESAPAASLDDDAPGSPLAPAKTALAAGPATPGSPLAPPASAPAAGLDDAATPGSPATPSASAASSESAPAADPSSVTPPEPSPAAAGELATAPDRPPVRILDSPFAREFRTLAGLQPAAEPVPTPQVPTAEPPAEAIPSWPNGAPLAGPPATAIEGQVATPAEPAPFLERLPEPAVGPSTPRARPRNIPGKPSVSPLPARIAPALDDDFAQAAGALAAPPPEPALEEAVEAPVTAEPLPPEEFEVLPPRVHTVEPSPRPATGILPYAPGEVTYAHGMQRRFWMIAAAMILVGICATAAVVYLTQRPQPRVLKFAVPPPEHTSYPGTPSVSPDGRFITFSAVGPEGKRMLWLRPLDALHASVIPDTENGFAPFWSPDSTAIAFFAENSLKKVNVTGGPAIRLCAAASLAGGGTWSRDGTILFAPNLASSIFRVPASGGKPEPVTAIQESDHQRAHLWPRFLPDGKHFIFFILTDFEDTTGVYAGSLGGKQVTRLLVTDTNAVYSGGTATESTSHVSSQGYLLFIRNRNLFGQSFNASNLTAGEDPVVLAENIGSVRSMGLAPISVSDNGVLIYQVVDKPTRQMQWVDRSGRPLATAAEPGEYGPPRIAPDGKRAIAGRLAAGSTAADLWLLTFDGNATPWMSTPQHEGSPVWSADGSRVAYFSGSGGNYEIFIQRFEGAKPEPVVRSPQPKNPTDWSPDGKYLLYTVVGDASGAQANSDLWVLHLADRQTYPLLNTIYSEGFATFSPDGRWIAYQSDESGRQEVYVQEFLPKGGNTRRFNVSRDGGGLPRWRRDGKEMFYMTPTGRLMAVDVHVANGEFLAAVPHPLFYTRPVPKTWNLYDAAPDGQTFLLNVPLEWSSAAPITVVTNWTEKVRH